MFMKHGKLILFAFFSFSCFFSLSQADTLKQKIKVVGLPILYYQPETRWAGGVAGFLSFKTDPYQKDSLNWSQIALGGAYTQEKQILTYASFDVWMKKNAYNLNGEIGYYKYFYYFHGIGNDERSLESYNLNFARLRATFEKRVYPATYVGVKYVFDQMNFTRLDTMGIIYTQNLLGMGGGIISGLGMSARYDTRNSTFYPTQGYQIRANSTFYSPVFGSDYTYNVSEIDAIKYFDLKKDRVLATYVYGRFIAGDAPFFHLSMLGGNKKMRGYYQGFYRDKQLLGWQTEYRTPVWWRFGAVAFVGNAVVAPTFSQFALKHVKTTAGLGLRFLLDKERKINLRIDYALSKESSGFYLTIGEAF
ncbi:Surface antigen [Lishizhenia tianjinensis]|uniref:Surface antigen n=2 Tax=Lishizhenia tianjinensis TaxID=477690 RepID=A0A1I7B510_9FLAO|nr:Surface antigen [Lishizhenia tianjinensis]